MKAFACAGVVLSLFAAAATAGDGWQVLFDGKSLDGWRAYGGKAPIGEGWKV